MTDQPDQPDRNVEIARILGDDWNDPTRCDYCNWPLSDGHCTPDCCSMVPRPPKRHAPEYDKDSAFILRMMEINLLRVYAPNGLFEQWTVRREDQTVGIGVGKSIPDAVLNWIIAADAAGIEVKR
jgi:hypothetical protein